MLESLSNTVKCLQAVWLATLLKRNLRTGVLDPAIHKCSLIKLFWNNSQNSQKNTCVGEFLNKVAGPQKYNFIKKRLTYRSSHLSCYVGKGVLRNFAKFTEKYQFQSFIFDKGAVLSRATLLKKRLCHRCFPVVF